MARKKSPKPETPQYIYVMAFFGYYKIGRTWNIEHRMKTLSQTLLPEPSTVVLSGRVYSGKRAEKTLHDRYASKRIRGEWFALDSNDLLEIQAFLKSKEHPCGCIAYEGPPRMCSEAARLRRELGNLSHRPPISETEFMQTPYVRHFLEL